MNSNDENTKIKTQNTGFKRFSDIFCIPPKFVLRKNTALERVLYCNSLHSSPIFNTALTLHSLSDRSLPVAFIVEKHKEKHNDLHETVELIKPFIDEEEEWMIV